MIGPKFRLGLRIVAYALLVGGALAFVGTIYDHVAGVAVQANPLVLAVAAIIALAGPAFQGGALLALLSIDERLERKG